MADVINQEPPADLQCPITHDWLEDPISVPCCARAFSRLPFLEYLGFQNENEGIKRCPACRGDVSDFDAVSAPKLINIANLVESTRNIPPTPSVPKSTPQQSWHCELTVLDNEQSVYQTRIARLQFSNSEILFKTLLIP